MKTNLAGILISGFTFIPAFQISWFGAGLLDANRKDVNQSLRKYGAILIGSSILVPSIISNLSFGVGAGMIAASLMP